MEVSVGSDDATVQANFDDLRLEQTQGLIVQEQHQYAYGSPLTGLNYAVGTKRYRYGYQGQFAERDTATGWESFELRLYNSRIGRWTSYDPDGQYDSPYLGMDNNPVSFMDPDGGWTFAELAAKIAQGFNGGKAVALDEVTVVANGAAQSGLRAAATQVGAAVLRSASNALEASIKWGDNGGGEAFGRGIASLVGAEQLGSIYNGFANGTDVYGEKKMTGMGMVGEAASFGLIVIPGSGGAKGAIKAITKSKSVLGHIFREALGHVNPATLASQNRYIRLFENVANNSANLNPNVLTDAQRLIPGFEGFSQTFRNGKQVWTHVLNGKITNAGVNLIPK